MLKQFFWERALIDDSETTSPEMSISDRPKRRNEAVNSRPTMALFSIKLAATTMRCLGRMFFRGWMRLLSMDAVETFVHTASRYLFVMCFAKRKRRMSNYVEYRTRVYVESSSSAIACSTTKAKRHRIEKEGSRCSFASTRQSQHSKKKQRSRNMSHGFRLRLSSTTA